MSPTVDSNEFYKQMTMRICGHLEIEKALQTCMEFLCRHVPADEIYLDIFESDRAVMRVVAMATPEFGKRIDHIVAMPKEALANIASIESTNAIIINRVEDHPVAGLMNLETGDTNCSNLIIPLAISGSPIGVAALVKNRRDAYTQKHADLFGSLNEPFAIALMNCMRHDEVVRLRDLLKSDNRDLFCDMRRLTGDRIVGANFGLATVMERVRQVAAQDSPVLLLGETGVGKDVIASAIHYSSSRKDGPFIKVNSGAIPDSLIDSELFGHEKGAFTGAITQKRGRFERAHTGTLFLDEIGELPPAAQVRLLRVLQNKEIERVGSTESIKVDVRIVAATHRNLEKLIQADKFREDLWYRLNVFPILIPPLRNRTEDIPALAHHFIEEISTRMRLASSPELAEGTLERLKTYSWPGNVRELENIVERALILNPNGPLDIYPDGDRHVEQRAKTATSSTPQSFADTSQTLDEVTSAYIRRVLEKTNGQIHGTNGAAAILGINANTLRYRMDKLRIPYRKTSRGAGRDS